MGKEYCRPTPLRLDEIEDLKRRYVWAASQLAQAGADGIIVSRVGAHLPDWHTCSSRYNPASRMSWLST